MGLRFPDLLAPDQAMSKHLVCPITLSLIEKMVDSDGDVGGCLTRWCNPTWRRSCDVENKFLSQDIKHIADYLKKENSLDLKSSPDEIMIFYMSNKFISTECTSPDLHNILHIKFCFFQVPTSCSGRRLLLAGLLGSRALEDDTEDVTGPLDSPRPWRRPPP